MSDEQSTAEKSEKPTQKKLDDAHKKGSFPKSKDVPTALVMLALGSAMYLGSAAVYDRVAELFNATITAIPLAHEQRSYLLVQYVLSGGKIILIILVVAAIFAVIGMAMQVGFNISTEPVKPQISRVNPVEGLKRLFKWRQLFDLIKSMIGMLLVGFAVFVILKARLNDLVHLPMSGIHGVLAVIAEIALKMSAFVIPLFAAQAAIDYLVQRFVWFKDQHMTKQDIKRENKDSQGDPHVKSRRANFISELLGSDNTGSFNKASLVIYSTNGQLIALYYEPAFAELPFVILKEQGGNAEDLLATAKSLGMHAVQDDELAKKLFMRCGQNQFIPEDTAEAVAQLLVDGSS